MRAERDAVKRLALRGEWGPSVDSTMMLFLERLWADCTDASISSFALTPWGQVSAAATLLLMAVTPPHRDNYLSGFSGFPPLIRSVLLAGHRLPMGQFFTRAAWFCRCSVSAG